MHEWEQLLSMYQVIHVSYNEETSKLHLLLDNGTVCHFSIHSLTSDIECINLDRLSLSSLQNSRSSSSSSSSSGSNSSKFSHIVGGGGGSGSSSSGGSSMGSSGNNNVGSGSGGTSGQSLSCGLILPQGYFNYLHAKTPLHQHSCILAQQNDINFYLVSLHSHTSSYGHVSSSQPPSQCTTLSSCTYGELSIETLMYMTPVEMKPNHNNSLLCVKYHNGTVIILSMNDQRLTPISCIYKCPVLPKSQQEQRQWSRSAGAVDIMYFAFSNKKPFTLITLEVTGQTNVYWNVYERVMSRDFHRIQAHKIKAASPVTCCAMSPSETHICICCSDGTILLWASDHTITSAAKSFQTNKIRLTIQKIAGKTNPFVIRWHSSGGLLLIGFNSTSNSGTSTTSKQEFYILDLGLNIMSFHLSNGMTTNVLHSQNLIGKRSKLVRDVSFLESHNSIIETTDSTQVESNSLPLLTKYVSHQLIAFTFDKGPVCLVRIDLTLCNTLYEVRPLSSIHLLTMHIHNNCLEESRTLIRNISNPGELYCALCLFVNYLLRQVDVEHNSMKARAYLDIILDKYANMFKESSYSVLDSVSQENSSRLSQLHNLYRRYFIYTLRHGYYEKAFQIAATINDEDMFQQIYHATRESQYYEMSYLSFMKSSEPFKKHMRQLKELVKQGSQAINNEAGSNGNSSSRANGGMTERKHMEPIERLVSRYLSSTPATEWTGQEAERLGVYFEMEGDLDNAVKCFSLSSETREQRSRVQAMRDALYDYQNFIHEN